VVVHDLSLITDFLGQLEQQSVLEARILSLQSFLFSLFEIAKGVLAAGLVGVNVPVIVRALHQLIVDVHGFPFKVLDR
jgi:hypothetical protein